MKRALDIALPLAVAALVLGGWEWAVAHWQVPPYVLPAPSAIAKAFVQNHDSLMTALTNTFLITVEGFVGAFVAALAFGVLFSQSRLAERALSPYAVIMQVTPVVAIAPLLMIWVGFDHINFALSLLAGVIAFFPILSNITRGLQSADFNLMDLARLYRASRWQILWRIQMPSALPFLLTGMKIGGVIALIGEVTAEYAAGSGTATGLAWRITESSNRLEIPTTFAALGLLSVLGVLIFIALSLLEWALLRRWHESAITPS